jgi:hypothetical protein
MDGIQSVLDIFATELADVRFADLDAPMLARLAAEVEKASVVAATAQAELNERRKVLLDCVQRAVAYARVYAENDAALSAKLDAVMLPRPARKKGGEETLALPVAPPPPGPREKRGPRGRGELLLPSVSASAVGAEE